MPISTPVAVASAAAALSTRGGHEDREAVALPTVRTGDDEQTIEDDRHPPNSSVAAYSVVAGGFLTLFCSFGFLSNFAAFQTYYVDVTLRGHSNADVAWIGAFQSFAILASNLVLGPLFDRHGPRPLLLAATLLFTFGCMMTSLSTAYYQIFLAQGVVVGTALGAAFITPIACVMHWFPDAKRRAIVLCIVTSGSAIGGVVWPIATYALLRHVGFAWTWRALGFIGLGLLSISCVTVRMPPHAVEARQRRRGPQPVLALDAFRTPRYVVYTVAYCLFALSVFPLLFYFPQLTTQYGVTQSLSFYDISIINAFSFVGRLAWLVVAHRAGLFNATIACIASCAVVSFACMAITSGAGAVAASGAYGFVSGGALSLTIACVPHCLPADAVRSRLGAAMGQCFFVGSFFALLSGPIAGWILESSVQSSSNFVAMEGFVGACLLLSAAALAVARHLVQPNWRRRA